MFIVIEVPKWYVSLQDDTKVYGPYANRDQAERVEAQCDGWSFIRELDDGQ